LATSLFHVRGEEKPSSKKERDIVAACGGTRDVFVKDVEEGPLPCIAAAVVMDMFEA
jgi:hypothetical protein